MSGLEKTAGGQPPTAAAIVAEALAQMVLTQMAPSSSLPSEGDLALRFEVSRLTVREAVKILRRDGFKSPIILLTGHDSDSDEILGLESGANDYLTKPFRYPVLLARINAALRQRDQSEERQPEETGGHRGCDVENSFHTESKSRNSNSEPIVCSA